MIFAPNNLSELSRWLVLRFLQSTAGQETHETERDECNEREREREREGTDDRETEGRTEKRERERVVC